MPQQRSRSRRRRGPRGGNPRPSQLSRRERGLPVLRQGHAGCGKATERETGRAERDREDRERGDRDRRDRGRGDRGRGNRGRGGRGERDERIERVVYRALSPRRPRYPPPGWTETWEVRSPPPAPHSELRKNHHQVHAPRASQSRTPPAGRRCGFGRWKKVFPSFPGS